MEDTKERFMRHGVQKKPSLKYMENRVKMTHKHFIRVSERDNREKSGSNTLKDNG